MAILPPHHNHVGVQRAPVFGTQQQQRIAAAQDFDPTFPDLIGLARVRLDAIRFAGHDRHSAVRKHAVGLIPGLGLLHAPLQVNHLPRVAGQARNLLLDLFALIQALLQ
ncbi:hypothetical protein D3C84_954030 [compost metagenome]